MPLPRRPVRRTLLAAVSMLVATTAFTTALATLPATPALADAPGSEPLLLIHGFNDDCKAAWNPDGLATTAGFLSSYGFTNQDLVGYYTSTANSTDGHDSDSGACSENLNSLPSMWSANTSLCNNLASNSADYGTKNDHIDRLACLLAWYIWNKYSQYGRSVNVLAHSMGGLIVRDALGRTQAHAANFPPQQLWVSRVVTVATPHGGVDGLYRFAAQQDASTNGLELDDMQPGSPFMNMVAGFQRPQGIGGTYWALMGASDGPYYNGLAGSLCAEPGNGYPVDGGNGVSCAAGDGDAVVATDSQMAMQADAKVVYGAQLGPPVCVPSSDPNAPPVCVATLNVADIATQYEHEVNMPCADKFNLHLCFNKGPYYLNDASTDSTKAWVCASGCANTSIPGGAPVTTSRSLITILSWLNRTVSEPSNSSTSLVLRSTSNNNFVSAELGYTGSSYGMLRARAATKGSWESWTEVFLPNGGVAIKSNANGLFVSAEVTYPQPDNGELRARSQVVGPWETFDISNNSDGSYSIKSRQNGLFVSAEMGYTGSDYAMLRARASTVGSWEKFTQNTGPAGCTNYGGPSITGPNGCVGFHTQAPPGQPASGNVWYSSAPYGYMGQEIWTYANGTVATSTAVYQLSGLDTIHLVTLQAWIPDHTSDALHAHYHYCSPSDGCGDGYINQAANTNVWVTLGVVCTTDGTATITLADDGGDTYPRVVGADAIRAIRTSNIIC